MLEGKLNKITAKVAESPQQQPNFLITLYKTLKTKSSNLSVFNVSLKNHLYVEYTY